MRYLDSAQLVAEYISSLEDFIIVDNYSCNYDHMGAILSNAILQAGVNYRTVVEPRIRRLLQNYPEARITSVFLEYIHKVGAHRILCWKHPEKPRRLLELTTLFFEIGIETEYDLQNWLFEPTNGFSLMQIKGIGPKTVDYLKNLVNIPSVAVDRHIKTFIKNAGVGYEKYDDIRSVVFFAANILEILPSQLDHSIWHYMANKVE